VFSTRVVSEHATRYPCSATQVVSAAEAHRRRRAVPPPYHVRALVTMWERSAVEDIRAALDPRAGACEVGRGESGRISAGITTSTKASNLSTPERESPARRSPHRQSKSNSTRSLSATSTLSMTRRRGTSPPARRIVDQSSGGPPTRDVVPVPSRLL